VELALRIKIAAFCRELTDNRLRDLAAEQNMEPVFVRARAALEAGRTGHDLEADLDALDVMMMRADGQGLFLAPTRQYVPLPMPGDSTGAQWWSCPGNRCAGRGRVRPGQDVPVCAAIGEQLVAGPITG
jgi:hypothetical protein